MMLLRAGQPVLGVLLALAAPQPAWAQLALPPAVAAPALTGAAAAPAGQFRLRPFGAADGLRNLIVVSIVQDGDGLLWVATEDGVYRYDGQQFAHYSVRDGLPTMGVRELGVAPDGRVCAGTHDGLVCWNGARFTAQGADGLTTAWIQSLAAGPGALWAGTTTGLFVRRGAGAFVPAAGWPATPARPVRAIWVDGEGVVVSDGSGVQLTAGDGRWQRLGDEVGLGRERIDAVLRDHQGTLWIRSVHHLWLLPRGQAQVTDLSDGLPSGSDVSGMACRMAITPWGDVLVGSERGVAYRRGDRWQLIDGSPAAPLHNARALLVDREGTVWIGAMGLTQWMGRGLITRHDASTGLPDATVWTIGRDRHAALWLGTGRCLARAVERSEIGGGDPAGAAGGAGGKTSRGIDGSWECLPASVGWAVRTFVFPPQGGVFLGGGPPDLLYIDPAGQPTRLEPASERVPDRHIMAATLGPEGDLWLATTTGLYRLAGAVPGRPERVTVPGARPESRIISLLAVDGRLWAAGDAGLAVLDRGSWRLLDRGAGFRASGMRHVIRRRDGRMCVSFTDVEGLTCFRWDGARARELTDITPADGLTSGRVYFVGEDRAERLWIGSGDGVDVVTARGVDHFDENDGLAGNDSTARAFFEDDDGSLWLGSSTGVSHLLAQHYAGPPVPPRTVVLHSAFGGLAATLGAADPVIPHERNAVVASFAADSFLHPRRVEFQVRLLPLEREWSATRLREARYPALPPGGYHLEIRARTGTGAWGAPASVGFTILPAWWQTRWFLAIAVGLSLASIAGIVTWLWQRRALQLRRQSDASFRDLLEAMPDLVSVYRDRALVYLNQAARQLVGLTAARDPALDDLVARIHPDDRARAAALFLAAHRAVPPAQTDTVELRLSAGDGNWRNCELGGRRIDLGAGQVVVITGRDVTERDRLRAKLLLSDRMASLGTLAAGVAHEINNPLAYVTANLEVVSETLGAAFTERSAEQHAELRAAIGDAREGAERVRKIVHGLRSFSRSEEEKRVAIALPDVLAAAIRLTANEVKHRAVLVKELGATPLVLADDGRLTQVFINLLVNAAHAIPEGHTDANRITVRTRSDAGGRAIVEIQDTGAGMPPEVQARAFDPFFTTKEVGEGTGLGLSICHGIVSGLGGQIAIESAPGRGCLIRVALPPAPVGALPRATTAPIVGAALSGRRRVLIVDDDARIARAFERILRPDYDLTLASCGADAIAQVAAGAWFDAIVTDVMMPNMTGIELFDQIERLAPDQAARIIFLTGGVFTAQSQSRLEASGNLQLQKPVTAQELRESVAQVVARGELELGEARLA